MRRKTKSSSIIIQSFKEVEPFMQTLMSLIHDTFPEGTHFRAYENPCYFGSWDEENNRPAMPIDYIEVSVEGQFCIRVHIERCHIPAFFHESFTELLPLFIEQVAYRWKQAFHQCNEAFFFDDWIFNGEAKRIYTYSQRRYVRYMHELMEDVQDILPFCSRIEGDAHFTGHEESMIEQPVSWLNVTDNIIRYYVLRLDIILLETYIESFDKTVPLSQIRILFKQQLNHVEKNTDE